jgi:hypothetical protein
MAEAKTTYVVKKVMTEIQVQMVSLTLTIEEAEVLQTACGFIGGPPDGLRGKMDKISDALADLGFDGYDNVVDQTTRQGIIFKD